MNKVISPLMVGAWLVAGCAAVPEDLGRSDVEGRLVDRGYPIATDAAPNRVQALAAETLSAQTAVELALVNNPDVVAEYARLGFGAAELYAGGRIANPVLDVSRLSSDEAGAGHQLTVGLMATLSDLITLSARRETAELDFAHTTSAAAANIAEIAHDTETAYYEYVHALQTRALRDAIAEAERLSLELAQRFAEAGNLTRLELAEHRAATAEADVEASVAIDEALNARAHLAALIGLSVADGWTVPPRIPGVPEAMPELTSALQSARSRRLDLAAAQAHVEAKARRAGYAGWEGWLGELEIGYEREREPDDAVLRGPLLAWSLPLFNTGRNARLEADAALGEAVAEAAGLVVIAENQIRTAHAQVANAALRVEKIATELLPARRTEVVEMQARVNFMLDGAFDLIAARQSEYAAIETYLASLNDYWLARADLARASGAWDDVDQTDSIDVSDLLQPERSGHEGMDHGDMDHEDMGHGDMDHGDMDHGDMDHGDMDHGDMDHGDMDHGDMDHGETGDGRAGHHHGDKHE